MVHHLVRSPRSDSDSAYMCGQACPGAYRKAASTTCRPVLTTWPQAPTTWQMCVHGLWLCLETGVEVTRDWRSLVSHPYMGISPMDDDTGIFHCLNCGTEWRPMHPLTFHRASNTWRYPCPVCQFPLSPRTRNERRSSLPAIDLPAQPGQFLADARAYGVVPDELVRTSR